MTQVFSTIAMNTPALSPGWTAQSAATGVNQNLVGVSPTAGSFNAITLNNFLAQSLQTEDLAAAGVALVSGTLYGAKLTVPQELSTTKGAVYVATNATGTISHGWLVIVDTNGNVVAQTADLAANAIKVTTAPALFSAPWTAPVTLSGGQYYVGAVQVSTATPSLLAGSVSPNAINNMGLTVPNASAVLATGLDRFAVLTTGLTTALPATPLANWGTNSTTVTADNTIQIFAALL
jgi:hypothetical protein